MKKAKKGYKFVKSFYGKYEEIPEDWEIKKLEEIGRVIGGSTPDTNNPEYWNGDILWAVPTDITALKSNYISDTKRKITNLGLSNSSAKLLPEKSVLITSRATIGECAIASKPITTNQGFQSIICSSNYDNEFIFYSIKYNKKRLYQLARGSTFLEVSNNNMKKVTIPTPTLISEQQKIASILSNVDSLIRQTDIEIEITQKLKKGLMQKLLTKGIGHKEFKKIKWLFGKKTEIPENWEIKDLGDIILNSRNGFSGQPNDRSIGLPRLGISSISDSDSVYVNENIYRYIEIPESKIKNFLIQKNDLLVCRQNGNKELVGKIRVIKESSRQMIFSDSLILIQVKQDQAIPEFLVLFLSSKEGRKQVLKYAETTAGNFSINVTNYKKIQIPIPPLYEQKQIVSPMLYIESQLRGQQEYRSNLQIFKKGLMQKLLTGHIRIDLA